MTIAAILGVLFTMIWAPFVLHLMYKYSEEISNVSLINTYKLILILWVGILAISLPVIPFGLWHNSLL